MKTILITDDQEEIRELVALTLSIGNFHLLKARSGLEAIEVARSRQPDLILMDVTMPGGIDGFEATRLIKNDPQTCRCPVLILSGRCEESDLEESLAVGAVGYIAKPFSPLALIRKVREITG